MPETILSPGVVAFENDQSFIPQGPIIADSAIIGPTVKGPVGIPTIITSFDEFKNKFGEQFKSGSNFYSYYTSIAAYHHFNQNGGDGALLVTRVVSGSTSTDWRPATSSTIPNPIAVTSASATINMSDFHPSGQFTVNGITINITGSHGEFSNTNTLMYIPTASSAANLALTSSLVLNVSSSVFTSSNSPTPLVNSLDLVSASNSSTNLILSYTGSNGLTGNTIPYISGSVTYFFTGGTNVEVFTLETISEGVIMNSSGSEGTNSTLPISGTADNFRWEIVNPDTSSGEFSLLIRQGNDSIINKTILNTIGPVTLDPNSSNYIEKVIGNQIEVVKYEASTNEYYTQLTGSYPNQYSNIRVKEVNLKTPNYFDNNGDPKSEFTSSIPMVSSGSFGGGGGSNLPTGVAGAYYENVTDSNIQGLIPNDYTESISLLSNKDAYKYGLIITPGLIADPTNFPNSNKVVNTLINMVESREDCMTVIDLVKYNEDLSKVIANAGSKDSSYAATYWPWIQTQDMFPTALQNVWTPPSTLVLGTYALNDSVGFPWLAPAGTTRGITNAINSEKPLTQGVKDILYSNRVNPITNITTPGNSSFVLFGQKTLQVRNTSLTRVNVRRLLIALKNTISNIADSFVFEQNTPATRNEFLSLVNPYLNLVQETEGLTSFQVIMDETNNPPSVIDNNQLVGQIFIQPTKTTEFISLTFNVLPTGVSFPGT